MPNLIKESDDGYWVVSALQVFMKLIIKTKQDIPLEKQVKKDYVELDKVVKVNKKIPVKYLDKHNFEYVMLGGLYIKLPVLIINKDRSLMADSFLSNVEFIENGFPDNYYYGARQFYNNEFLVVLAYNEVCPLFITQSSDWSYFELC